MARQPTLTVNVQSAQFQQFVRNFNAFSNNVRNLNSQFAQITAAMQRTNRAAQVLNATMRGLLSVTTALGSSVGRITGHFLKWSTIIGGIGLLLGMGGSLFGIDRLATNLMQKRRTQMGLGGDFGRTQASMIYNQSFLESPRGVLENIRMGLGGGQDQLRPLLALGIPFGTKMSPDEVLDKILEKMPALLRSGGPGTELMTAKAYGLDRLGFSPMDLMRMATKEGEEEIKYRREQIKAHQKELEISPKALRGWADLDLQIQIAKASIENIFGVRLAGLTKPLTQLSEAFMKAFRAFMNSPIVEKIISKLTEWLTLLTGKLEKLTEKDIQDFMDRIEKLLPTMEQMEKGMDEFVKALADIVKFIDFIMHPTWGQAKDYLFGKEGEAAKTAQGGWSWRGFGFDPMNSPFANWLKGGMQQPGGGGGIHGVPVPTPPATAPPGGGGFGAGATPYPQGGLGGFGTGGSFTPGTPSWRDPFTMGPQGGLSRSVASLIGSPGGGTTTNLFDAALSRWQGAASGIVPRSGGGNVDPSMIDRTLKGNNISPLSENNWQSNRVANLTIRNVPGANIFMTAAGMTG